MYYLGKCIAIRYKAGQKFKKDTRLSAVAHVFLGCHSR